MKKIFCLPLLLVLLLPAFAEAQTSVPPNVLINAVPPKITIKGKILDQAAKTPLEFATISLYSALDSSVVAGAYTEPDGSFSFKTEPGQFYAVFEYIAYEKEVIRDIQLDRKDDFLDLGTIFMTANAEILDEIVVKAERSQMQLGLDKKVFNVGSDLSNQGGTAEDILDNVPSVTVDIEGNVALRGNTGVRILIDGKPTNLAGADNANGLRQLPANLIEKVEVITNPSARYEAEGMAGIINIVLKKDRRSGLNGSVDAQVGHPENYGGAANLNYRKKSFNFFTNIGANKRINIGGGEQLLEVFRSADTTQLTERNRDHRRGGLNYNLRFGADYFFNPETSLTGSFVTRFGEDRNNTDIEYRDYINSYDNPTYLTTREDDEVEDEFALQYSLNFRREFGGKDHVLTADLEYQDNVEEESSEILEQAYQPDGTPSNLEDLMQRSRNEEKNQRWIAKADYVRPIGEEGKFELGYLGSFRHIRNDFLVEEFDDFSWRSLPEFTNDFVYDEIIQGLYTSLGSKLGRISFQGGLRLEATTIDTELKQYNERNDRDYLNLFPSAFLGYEFEGQNSLQFSYSRRIRRPSFWNLNPFFSFSDPRFFWAGNPDLEPEFTHSIELSHIKYWGQTSISSSIYYRHTTDVIQRITVVDNEGNSISRPQNLLEQEDVGAELTFSSELAKWWRVDGNFNFFRSLTNGTNLGDSIFLPKVEAITLFGRATSRMTLFKDLDVQLRANYRAPRKNNQGKSFGIFHMDLGLSKDVLKEKGTLTLSVRDLFNSRRWRYENYGINFFSEGDFQWRQRTIVLSFNYRINQKKRRGRSGDYEGGYEGGGEGF